MGNAETRTYEQVSTHDDTKSEDLMFVFHSTDDDCSERVVHDELPPVDEESVICTILQNKRVISDDNRSADPCLFENLRTVFRPGDAVEVRMPNAPNHWIIYTGSDACVHMLNGEIIKEDLLDACAGCIVRNVSNVYTMKPLSIIEILSNAKSQVGKLCQWPNSECFVLWCRTGLKEFMNSEQYPEVMQPVKKTSATTYTLQIYNNKREYETLNFDTLPAAIQYKRSLNGP